VGVGTALFAAAAEPPGLYPARLQMAFSLGSHIVLAAIGVAFPAMIWVVHRRGLRGDEVALGLAKRWSKVAAVLFAVRRGVGTILSFEMGLLWPGLMRTTATSSVCRSRLEGLALFTEAIFLGVYLYGWNRLPPARTSPRCRSVSGVVGTFCILSVNAWMNSPSGFRLVDGEVVDVDPWAAMFNDAVWLQFIHMLLAAHIMTGFVVARLRGGYTGR
jgi:cytochrome d ubiquinol oxidase subunit I